MVSLDRGHDLYNVIHTCGISLFVQSNHDMASQRACSKTTTTWPAVICMNNIIYSCLYQLNHPLYEGKKECEANTLLCHCGYYGKKNSEGYTLFPLLNKGKEEWRTLFFPFLIKEKKNGGFTLKYGYTPL